MSRIRIKGNRVFGKIGDYYVYNITKAEARRLIVNQMIQGVTGRIS